MRELGLETAPSGPRVALSPVVEGKKDSAGGGERTQPP